MRRALPILAAAALALGVWPAHADPREVSMGNYWYRDDASGQRDRIVVEEGDQIRFTVREPDYPPHSVNIDEYGIRSGDMLLFDTYTTPPLDRAGEFLIYCEAHRDRGHVATLVVRAAPAPQQPASGSGSTPAQQERREPRAQQPAEQETPADADPEAVDASEEATEALTEGEETRAPAPSGRGVAEDQWRAEPDPDSLAGLLGRTPVAGPWTHAVRLSLVAGIPLWAVTLFALRRERQRRRQEAARPTQEPVVVIDLASSEVQIRGNGETRRVDEVNAR